MYQQLSLRFTRAERGVRAVHLYMYEKIFGEDFLRSVGGDRWRRCASVLRRYKERTVALKRLTLAQDRFFAELESRRKEYEAIATPALVIAGEEDRVVAPKVQRKITTILPNSRFELIPDSGHVVYLEHPDVFFGILREFFARASDRVVRAEYAEQRLKRFRGRAQDTW